MNTITGNVALTTEQKETVKNWFEINYPDSLTKDENSKPVFGGLFTDSLSNEHSPQFIVGLNETGMSFQFDLYDELFQQDTLFGLNKEVFARVVLNQRYTVNEHRWGREPNDPSNYIKGDVSFGAFHSPKNKHWYETDKRWKDRVYSLSLLIERLEQAVTRSHVVSLKELLKTASSGAQEYHKPIDIQMILEHRNDADLTNKTTTILQEIVDTNVQRIARFKVFKDNLHQLQLTKDFEGDRLTPNILGNILPRNPKI